jgi:hypothetical protein
MITVDNESKKDRDILEKMVKIETIALCAQKLQLVLSK